MSDRPRYSAAWIVSSMVLGGVTGACLYPLNSDSSVPLWVRLVVSGAAFAAVFTVRQAAFGFIGRRRAR